MPAIVIDNLSKRYGDVAAVEDVALSVPEGEAFGYLGPNGAGKTTTIRCLLGFIAPTKGRIEVFGRDVTTSLREVLTDTGYLPGEFGLWPSMTGEEVLDYLGALHPAPPTRRAELCERFDLSREALKRQVRFYSRGMKQKVGLIQAFQHRPRLVVLDEPTEGLDPVMKERFVDLLADHKKDGGTTFLSSHILSEVEIATDRVAIIKGGRLVLVGDTRDVTGERVRKCTLTLKELARADLLAIEGVREPIELDPLHIRFEYVGDMEPLIARLAEAKVAEFLAEPESLTEAFFDVFDES